jgi:hypothetical protein
VDAVVCLFCWLPLLGQKFPLVSPIPPVASILIFRTTDPPSTNTGNRENTSENARPALHTDATFSPKGNKKPAGSNLRKSIAWNPAFFTEEGSTIIVLFATSTMLQFGKLLAE